LVNQGTDQIDRERRIHIQPSGAGAFEIHVPEIFNRLVLIETEFQRVAGGGAPGVVTVGAEMMTRSRAS